MKAWRSTDKVMPPEDTQVLVSKYDGTKLIAEWDGESWIDTNGYIHNQSAIIYWMPIPILPNE
jgi:hypothetical protein